MHDRYKKLLPKPQRLEDMNKFELWCYYNDTYASIHKNKHLLGKMQDDKGFKFMERGWMIALGIFLLFSYFGMCAGHLPN